MGDWQPGKKRALKAIGPGNAGSALAEMAIALPFFMMLLLGVIDFGRVFWAAIGVTQAARAAAQYGVQNATTGAATLYPAMRAAANSVATDYHLTLPTATVERYCTCTTAGGSTQSCNTLCPDGSTPKMYVTATIPSFQFTTFTGGNYPGIPGTISLTRTALLRAR